MSVVAHISGVHDITVPLAHHLVELIGRELRDGRDVLLQWTSTFL